MIKHLGKVNFRRIISILIFSATIVVGAYILFREGSKIPWQDFQLNFGLFFLSLVISGVGFFPAVIGWRGVLRIFNFNHLFAEDFRVFSFSMLGVILPGGIWSIVGRNLLYKESKDSSSLSITSASILEVILNGVAAWIIYWGGVFYYPNVYITNMKWLQYLLLALSFILIEPHVLRKIIGWILSKKNNNFVDAEIKISFFDILRILFFEIITLIFGGCAIFVLIKSIYPISMENLAPIVIAYCFSVAISKLFLGLPGTLLLKDTAMTLVLARILPLGLSLIFVVFIRIWTILSVLFPAAMVWLYFYFLKPGAQSEV